MSTVSVCKVYWKSGAVEIHKAEPQGYLNVGTVSFYIDEYGVHFEAGKLDKLVDTPPSSWEREKHNVIVSTDALEEVEYITLDNEIMYPYAERIAIPGERVIRGAIEAYTYTR